MSGFKKSQPGLRFSAEKITPDEIDRYEVYTITPAIQGIVWASAGTAGTASAIALTVKNTPDWPRNINFALAGSATGMAGTLVVNGKNQFGSVISESLGFGSADNGGTVVGTKVFAQITSGTLNYGTAVGNGTPNIGFVPGTNCLLGLPIKLGGSADVVHIGMTAGTGAITVNGGTIGGFVDVAMSAVRPPAAITGTNSVIVWAKSSYNAENMAVVANLSPLT